MTRKAKAVAFSLALCMVAPGVSHAGCILERVAEMPVAMEDERPIVTGQLNGIDVHFIADSGAFFSILTKASVDRFKLHLGRIPYGIRMRGVGGDAGDAMTTTSHFTFLGKPFAHADFLVGGDNVIGGDISGLLGDNILTELDSEFDLAKGMIRLFQQKGCGHQELAYWADDRMAVQEITLDRYSPFHLVGEAKVNGHRIRVLFDTGAETSILGLSAASRVGLSPKTPGAVAGGSEGGLGLRKGATWIVPVTDFQIGGEYIRNTRLRIGDLELNDADMLIGADFFLAHHVYASKSNGRLYFTYNGGPVFDLRIVDDPSRQATSPAAEQMATVKVGADADRLGQADLSRREFGEAKAYFDRAIELEPTTSIYRVHRARAELALKHEVAARLDLDEAVKLQPDLEEARLERGELALSNHDPDSARIDFDAAISTHPDDSDLVLGITARYENADQFLTALNLLDAWIAAHPRDDAMVHALDSRCWLRAQWNRDLESALADCNRSLRLERNAQTFDSRGLVYLRLGRLDDAIHDYNTALRLEPQIAWSLYGRGVAEHLKGQMAASETDIKLADQIAPQLAKRAADLGIAPPATAVKPPAAHPVATP